MADDWFCLRCRHEAPPADSDEFSAADWEAAVDDEGNYIGLICSGCMTREELEEMAQSFGEVEGGEEED